ncbi:HBL066Cp [Eremothecium sinecaudum]|uniref:HBL066Cp n=1 Tax=Eremothecium sinecaudum TaxID=45286 RepID=A0A109UWG1_9SACH|nr:HBL066Cp [Eremothecium sinecaudum]AMD18836.1 HBL066Cp [Eremothecium sinecaudum]
MKYLAAYLLLNAAGNTPNAENVKAVLESVGIEVDDESVNTVLTALEGKSVEELIGQGIEKLASVPTGGAGAAAGAASGAAATEEATEEAAEESAEESDDEMGFGLFD